VTTTHEVQVRDEEYTRQQVALAKAEWARTTHSTTTTVVVKPCPPPTTEPYTCKPPCATDCSKCPSQTVSTTTTTDTVEHGSSNSTTTTTDHGTTHTNTTTDTHTVVTNKAASNWTMSAVASLTLHDGAERVATPNYALSIGYKLIGPLSLSAAAYTDKTVVGSLNLDVGRFSVSADAGTSWEEPKLFYGGTLSYRVLGPVWVGVWGTNDRAFGLSASFAVK
jgi:hypothetical protein